MKILAVKRVRKTKEDYTSPRTNKTTHPEKFITADVIDVSGSFVRKLQAGDAGAWEELVATFTLRGKAKGDIIFELALGGCRRFKKEKGMPKIGEAVIK